MSMRTLIQRIRDELLATEDTVCLQRARLVTEAYQRHEADPVPIKRAKAFAHVLGHMDLDLGSNPIFAGNTSSRPRAWMLIPEHGFGMADQVLLENDGLEGLLDDAIPQDLLDYWEGRSVGGSSGIGHLAADLGQVVHQGLSALIDETGQCENDEDPARAAYREAMGIALQAVIDWAQRYARAAEAAAESAADPLIRAAHLRVASACRRVPAQPARDLFEALQAMVLVHLAIHIEGHGMSVSVGLPDRVLEPFIDDAFDPEWATDLISAFMLKLTANSVYGRGSLTQAITVGGADHEGRDRCNALTPCFLEACNRVRVGDPHLFLRWHDEMDPAIKFRAAELLASGLSMPLLINDAATAGGFMNAGVAPEDAWEYSVIGCNELGIPGRSAESATATAGSIQYLGLLNEMLLNHADPDSLRSTDAVLAALETMMSERAAHMRQWGIEHRARMVEAVPTPFTSALMRGCIRRGQDLLVGMDYHLPGVYERGLTNAVNALAAIEQAVFEDHALSLGELVAAMRDDFPCPEVLARIQAAPKWGTDDRRADKWVVKLIALRERVLNAVDERFGGAPHMQCHVVRSLHHVDGKLIAASPDGRHAWTPVADSIGAQTGAKYSGPTAVLNSVLTIDAANHYRGGYNLNITLPVSRTSPQEIVALVETFFGRGGQELQINCLDAGRLRAACKAPDQHRELMVRIAGFTARFIDLSATEQAEMIERADALT